MSQDTYSITIGYRNGEETIVTAYSLDDLILRLTRLKDNIVHFASLPDDAPEKGMAYITEIKSVIKG